MQHHRDKDSVCLRLLSAYSMHGSMGHINYAMVPYTFYIAFHGSIICFDRTK